ncbi:hypothetical protein A4D02_32045 [Niastella koreensis]|nr:hypothetical protein [Niastella koreensis]OQP46188.1 hypothetical protein A4D02_32045 [Niastella koreensis]
MKKHLLTLLLAVTLGGFVNAQDSPPGKQFMQIVAVESIYSMPDNSVLIVTNPDGTQLEESLDNIYNAMGVIKVKSIKANERKIAEVLKRYTDKGWKLEQTIPFSIYPGKDANGALMTRYMLSKQSSISTIIN